MRQITFSLTVAAAVCAAAMTDASFFDEGRAGLSKDHREAAHLYGLAAAQVRNDSPKLDSADLRYLLQVLRKQLYGCWNPPAGVGGADAPSAIVRFKLKQDGSLAGEPVVVGSHTDPSRAFAKTALAAVKRCQPLRLPPNLYEFWKDVDVNFVANGI